MQALLVYPEYPVTFWSFTHALKFIGKKSSLPPLGILTVAAMLPKEWSIKLVDMNTHKLNDRDLEWADYVFISAMTIQQESAKQVIARCKALGKKIVGGGPMFSTDPDSYDDVDHLLLYEGEVCIPEFLRDLENGAPKRKYDFANFPELHETPAPAWHLVDLNDYAMLSIQYSRGCPFHCDFCNVVSLFGHKPRTKTSQQIIGELEAIYITGWRGRIFFVDDNFIGNRKHVKEELLPAIIDWSREKGYPFSFYTEVSINIVDDQELMGLMTDAGFDSAFIGIETVDEDSLEECGKSQNKKRDLVESVKRIQQNGIQVLGGFILGFDSDKPSSFDSMINFIQESGVITSMVGMLNAPLGTKLFERLKNEGRIIEDGFTGSNEMRPNFIPHMPIDDLVNGYHRVVRTIYEPKNFYARIKTFLENYRPKKHKGKKSGFGSVGAFFKSCLHLGVLSSGRLHYWRLLAWSLTKGMSSFSLAVKFSIYGYHYRKCAEKA